MASKSSLPPRRPRHPSPIYEQHPDLGEYVYFPIIDLWTNQRVTSEGHEILLAGRSRRPSEEQVQLWVSTEARLQELVSKGVAAIQAPPGMPRRSRFSQEDLSLREVRMESGGIVEFFFDTPLGDMLNLWPVVTFLGEDLQGWEWAA